MANDIASAARFPMDPGSTGNQRGGAAPDMAAMPDGGLDQGFFSFHQCPADWPSQTTLTPSPGVAAASAADFVDFTGGSDSASTEIGKLHDKIVALEGARADLDSRIAVLDKAFHSSTRTNGLAKLLIVLGGLLTGFGFHLLGLAADGRETGIAVMAIGSGLILMNQGWFLHPKGG